MATVLSPTTYDALQVGFGILTGDPDTTLTQAASQAQSLLRGTVPDTAILLTAGTVPRDPVSQVRSVLGPVGVAGAATSALLTDEGTITSGTALICLANAASAASGVAATSGPNLAEAAGRAARLVLAGWPFRARYPRGLGVAFAQSGSGEPGAAFLGAWRNLMGPKMRTVCGVVPTSTVYGSDATAHVVSAACLEAPYATGFGHSAFPTDGRAPDQEALITGAAEAAVTAVKRLQGEPARLVLVVETAARHRALGSAASKEWAAIRAEIGAVPCVGWLCESVAAYGRGVRPLDLPGALVIVALAGVPPAGLRDDA